jgi:hypothetical protein
VCACARVHRWVCARVGQLLVPGGTLVVADMILGKPLGGAAAPYLPIDVCLPVYLAVVYLCGV